MQHMSRLYKLLLVYTLLVVCTGLYLVPKKPLWNTPSGDFLSHYTAGKLLVNQPTKLYSLLDQREVFSSLTVHKTFLPFRNMPVTALVFVPLTLVSPATASNIWLGVNFLLLLTAGWLLCSAYKTLLRINTQSQVALSSLLFSFFALLFYPITDVFWLGQVELMVLLAFAAALFASAHHRYLSMGLCLAFFSLKPNFLVIVPFIIVSQTAKPDYLKAGLGFVAGCMGLYLVNQYLVHDPSFIFKYLRFLEQTDRVEFAVYSSKQFSLYSVLNKDFQITFKTAMALNGVIATGVFYWLAKVAPNKVKDLSFGLLCVALGTLFAVHVHPHSLVLLYPYVITGLILSTITKSTRLLVASSMVYLLPYFTSSFLNHGAGISSLVNVLALIFGLFLLWKELQKLCDH